MNKQPIRNIICQKNREISSVRRAEAERKIASQIEQLDTFSAAHTVALFVAMADEVSTMASIERWYTMGKQLALPVIEGESMQFYAYRPDALICGKYGIYAPDPLCCDPIEASQIELMILPGVSFTLTGERLGRGGGFYDRYLASPDFRAATIGICYAHQIVSDLPTDPHDIGVQRVIVG
ncbi:MAG: 5-formyltetrahydrofolate cyclo-ligase [Rikenellaceae bacterium]